MSSEHDDGKPTPLAPDAWNPLDGPEPSADELREAQALADALAHPPSRSEALDVPLRGALEVALRARATQPAADATAEPKRGRVVEGAVRDALAQRRAARFLDGRGRWLAVAAAGVFAVGGAGLLGLRAQRDVAIDEGPGISRPVGADVFDAPLPERPGARVMDRLADARMREYRDRVLFYGSPRARRAP